MLSLLNRAIARILAVFRSSEFDRDLDDELAAHIKLRTEDLIRQGTPAGDAEHKARIELGGLSQLREAHRETRGLPFLDTLGQDLRYTFRTLRHNPGFTVFAILIIGLGVGASATIFNIVNALLVRPLPFTGANRLVWISNLADDRVSEWSTQVGHYLDLRQQNKSFSDLTAYFNFFEPGDAKLTGNGTTERLSSIRIAGNFFPFLGIHPILGRSFTAAECQWNAAGVAILSYGLWMQHYASDPSVIGRTITLNGGPVTIVGVAPPSFDFGTVFAPGNRIDVYLPMPLTPETNNWGNTLAIIGRLQPGAAIQSARAEFRTLADQIHRQHPERNTLRPVLNPLDQHVTGRVQRALAVLAWAVGIVMLIVCANVANLQLARSAARQKEIAIRVAIGAGRRRLIRQMLTESLALSGCGTLLGAGLAMAGSRLLAGLDAFRIPLLSAVRMDAASLVFCLLIAILSGLIFGLAPALQVRLTTVHDTLKDSSRTSSGTKRHLWIRSTLVVSEIVFACLLLVGAGLLARSFLKVLEVNPGFQPEHAAALHIDGSENYSNASEREAFLNHVLQRVRAMPGISAAGLADVLPLVGDRSWEISAKGKIFEPGNYPEGFIRIVSDGYLQAMEIPLRAGRGFTEQDNAASEPVALVNETAARTLWPGINPIGQILMADGNNHDGRRVVGVVSDVRHRSLEQASGCEVYASIRQIDGFNAVYLIVRTSLPPAALAASIRTALHPIAPGLSTNEFKTLQEIVDGAVSPRRFVVFLISGFSVFAVLLAALGIYAVMSYSVGQRSTELGIRMALGASASDLQIRVLSQALGLAGIGMLIGGLAALFLSRVLGGLLFGVTPADPATFSGMLVVLAAVAGLAGYLPALRISKIQPIRALRAD